MVNKKFFNICSKNAVFKFKLAATMLNVSCQIRNKEQVLTKGDKQVISAKMVADMEEYMERPRGVKLINTADGHRLCTLLRRKGLYG